MLNPLNTRWSPQELGYALGESQTTILMAGDAATGCPAAGSGQPAGSAVPREDYPQVPTAGR